MALHFCRPSLEVQASSYDGLVIARQGSNRDEYNNRTSGNRETPVSQTHKSTTSVLLVTENCVCIKAYCTAFYQRIQNLLPQAAHCHIFKRTDILYHKLEFYGIYIKGKGLPQQAKVAQGVPGRLRPRIFLTFGTTRVVGRQPYAQAAFTPR
jgi:hypothetical protein